tara:strand:+ start:2383 stop:5433 length:3051 start_codon:yes stop_codon:yes gene_type:complete
MSDGYPKLDLETALEGLGKYFNALSMSAFYDLLKDQATFDPKVAADNVPLMPTDITAQLASFLFDVTQGGLTVAELLAVAKNAGYIGVVAEGEQQAEVLGIAGDKVDEFFADLFNQSLLFTYEDTGTGQPALNAFTESQGWSRNNDPDGTHIFSISDVTNSEVNKNKAAPPTKADPGLSVTQVFNPKLSISNHSATAIQVFLNAIPALEWSRCVPYFNVQLISDMNQLDDDGRAQTPTMFQFLRGSPITTPGTTENTFADARNVNVFYQGDVKEHLVDKNDPAKGTIIPATAGMELFTSPQTLVSADEAHAPITTSNEAGASRSAPVLDRFRPLMSITKFNVDIAPTQGLIAYKTAKMSFILHDRSRLAEVAQLVKPDLYKATELVIEYGWSHPEGALTIANNPFGLFLDSLRSREKYGVKNSSFSFNEDGSVGIDVELYMKGSLEIASTSIAKGEGVENAAVAIEELIRAIKKSQKNLSPAFAKGVTGMQVLNSVTDTASVASMDKKTLKELKKFSKATAKSDELDGINDALKDLWGKNIDGKGGVAKELNSTIAAAVARKEKLLSRGDDPFLRALNFSNKGLSKGTPDVSTSKKNNRKYVSLGKLLLIFVGTPLAETHNFDEVQFIFYPFNSRASYMHDFNLAQFPVHIETFVKKFAELKKITANLPLQEFMTFMNKEFLGTQDTHAYGLVHTFTGGDNKRSRRKAFKKDTKLADETQRVLKYAYGEEADVEFTMPYVKVVVESVPVNSKIPPSPDAGGATVRTLLRLHIVDEAASPHDGMTKMLSAARDSNLGYINALTAKVKDGKKNKKVDNAKLFQDSILAGIGDGLLEPVPSFSNDSPDGEFAAALAEKEFKVRIKGGFPALKAFVKRGVPSITIGSQNSAVVSAKLSSMNEPALSSIMMLQGGPKGGDNAQGARSAGLPLELTPVELGMDTFGCPLFQLGQEFFIDFGTGTNIDSIYTLYGISHALGPGEYKTSLKFKKASSYGSYKSLSTNISDALKAISENQKPAED